MKRLAILRGALAGGVCALALATAAHAQAPRPFDLPAGDLSVTLEAYIRQSGAQLIYQPSDVRGRRSARVSGSLTPEEALDRLLAGTGLRVARDSTGAMMIVRPQPGTAGEGATGDATQVGDIVVTGSRIRGGEQASPIIRMTNKDIKDSGLPTLGDVMRSIPQNFGGGQNPGVVGGAGDPDNRNINSSSTINLRGIGADATLTLLNGHRLAYDYGTQGIDIATIPVAAVDRLEVITDGASAIYGSDAVAGVVNVILKRDFQGLATTARFGASTDGGNVQQEYSVVGGSTWDGGGMIAVYDYQKNSPITARQRSYTQSANDALTLFPAVSQHSAVLGGHQRVGNGLVLSADATFGRRTTERVDPRSATLPNNVEGQIGTALTESYSVSPKIDLELASDLALSLIGTLANSKSNSRSVYYSASVPLFDDQALFDNKTKMVELSASGGVFDLNGNRVGFAAGAGYRWNGLVQRLTTYRPDGTSTSAGFSGTTSSKYVFGELDVPLITPANDAGIRRLSFTAALRYEKYKNGEAATPKFGAVFEPIEDIQLKTSWGRSFKAPTLYQRFVITRARVSPEALYGFPGAGTVIALSGGNPDLKNEKAKSWTVSAEAKPRFIKGLRVEVSYFRVDYRDRVVRAPVLPSAGVYANPSYRDLITLDPSVAQIEQALALSPLPPTNGAGRPYDPADVVAIIDGRSVNISRQKISGVDFAGVYELPDVADGTLTLSARASYLRSSQVLLPETAEVRLAGTIFDPPKWRARGSLNWSDDSVSLNAALNYRGPLTDDRRVPTTIVESVTTLDLTARLNRVASSGLLSGLEIGVVALNVLNTKPAQIRTTSILNPPYDSTNDSAMGRFVGVSFSQRW